MSGMPALSAAKNSKGILFRALSEIEMHRVTAILKYDRHSIGAAALGRAKKKGAEAPFFRITTGASDANGATGASIPSRRANHPSHRATPNGGASPNRPRNAGGSTRPNNAGDSSRHCSSADASNGPIRCRRNRSVQRWKLAGPDLEW
jgi:hypothetical protein